MLKGSSVIVIFHREEINFYKFTAGFIECQITNCPWSYQKVNPQAKTSNNVAIYESFHASHAHEIGRFTDSGLFVKVIINQNFKGY